VAQTNKSKIYDLIDDIKIAMLTTVDGRGGLHTRPMANQKAERSGSIWFFTDKDGSVASNISANPKLTLGYAASGAYVSVTGKGEMIDDRRKIDELWSEDVKAWFPKGKTDPNLTLLRVTPDDGEFWTFPSAPLSVAIGYVKAKLTGDKADDIGEHKKVAL
jgi:general stress protein 26